MKISGSKLRLAFLSIVALTLLVFISLDIYNISAENKETRELLSFAAQSEGEKMMIQSVRNLRNTSREELEAFEAIILSEDNIIPLIESIEAAGRQIGIESEITSVEKIGAEGEQQKIGIIIDAEGNWNDVFLLVKAVESLPNRVLLEDVSLNKNENVWKSKIAFSLYSFN